MKRSSVFILSFLCWVFLKPNLVFSEDKQLVGVFGASGRTGTHIIDELIRRDVNIRAYSRRTKENADTDSIKWVVADVTSKESLT